MITDCDGDPGCGRLERKSLVNKNTKIHPRALLLGTVAFAVGLVLIFGLHSRVPGLAQIDDDKLGTIAGAVAFAMGVAAYLIGVWVWPREGTR